MRHGRYLVMLAGIGFAAAGCGTVTAQTASQTANLTAAVTKTAAQTARIAVTTTVRVQGTSIPQMQNTSMSFTETGQLDFAHSRGMISIQKPVGIATETAIK